MGRAHGDLDFFEAAVRQAAGLEMDDTRRAQLAEVVARRAGQLCRGDVTAYRRRLEAEPDAGGEIVRLAAELSVGETHFFRQLEHWRALAERVLPERVRARGDAGALRLLSAGCATGEEAYTLAIVLAEHVAHQEGDPPPVLGIDINEGFLKQARLARYRQWSLRGVSEPIVASCFDRQGELFHLAPRYRRMVAFEHRNLHDPSATCWQAARYDVVFLRNVVMYHGAEATRQLLTRVAASLAPGGYLFLGHAETLRGLSDEFHLVHTHDAFYYQLKEAGAPRSAQRSASSGIAPVRTDARLPADLASDWVFAIGDASRRIESLRQRSRGPKPTPAQTPSKVPPQPDGSAQEASVLQGLAALIHQERYQEAERLVERLAPSVRARPDVLLLAAVLDANRGRITSAIGHVTAALAVDELNADAHHLLALCHEQGGDLAAALDANRVAIYLDRSFAAPHLHAARLAKGRGDRAAARRELQRALDLLPGEQELRVLLFGGGVGRDTLERLCRRELDEGGGAAE